jgi:hypothetical protein
LTISLWVREDTLHVPWAGETYISFAGDTRFGWCGIGHLYGEIQFSVGATNDDSLRNPVAPLSIAFDPADLHRWVFYSLVYDSGTFTAYKDGVPRGSKQQLLRITGDSAFIASHAWGGPDSGRSTRFSGAIDEVRIYNKALSVEEIQDLYVSGEPTSVDQGGSGATGLEDFRLDAAYPNPFNPRTTIGYSVASTLDLRLTVYDCLGREVFRLSLGRQAPGHYSVPFDALGLSSGMYICRLSSGSKVQTAKILLLK